MATCREAVSTVPCILEHPSSLTRRGVLFFCACWASGRPLELGTRFRRPSPFLCSATGRGPVAAVPASRDDPRFALRRRLRRLADATPRDAGMVGGHGWTRATPASANADTSGRATSGRDRLVRMRRSMGMRVQGPGRGEFHGVGSSRVEPTRAAQADRLPGRRGAGAAARARTGAHRGAGPPRRRPRGRASDVNEGLREPGPRATAAAGAEGACLERRSEPGASSLGRFSRASTP